MNRLIRALLVGTLVATFGLTAPIAAAPIGTDTFQRTWERTDKPVADVQVNRTWMWGPSANIDAFYETYAGAPENQRLVQYFDKSRMEDNSYRAGPPWDVTNGLLAKELITGQLQLGDDTYETRGPAQVNVAGDASDPNGPTYATFNTLISYDPLPTGSTITQAVNRSGTVGTDASLTAEGITAAHYVPDTDHVVASVFWDFMNSAGLVYEQGQFWTDALFENPYYATGFPLTEAYWTNVQVAGVSKQVLVQVFERRVLTYTPDNPSGWQVEAGNVGQHYYTWRYTTVTPPSPPSPPPPAEQYALVDAWLSSNSSWDVEVDNHGSVLVSQPEHGNINLYDESGYLHASFSSDAFTGLQFRAPAGMSVVDLEDDGLRVFFADGITKEIRVIIPAYDEKNVLRAFEIDWWPTFYDPVAVAVDPLRGFAYVAEIDIATNTSYVYKYWIDGGYITHWVGTNMHINGLDLDSLGNIYVTEAINGVVIKLSANNEYLTEFSGFGYLQDVTVDHANNIYVTDRENREVVKLDPQGNFITSWAVDGSGCERKEPPPPAEPWGIAVDEDGTVFVGSWVQDEHGLELGCVEVYTRVN